MDLLRAGHGAAFTVLRKSDLGEERIWEAMVANRRQRRVPWRRDVLTELAAPSIYSARGRWLRILKEKAGSRRER